jgi:hypothetical protein
MHRTFVRAMVLSLLFCFALALAYLFWEPGPPAPLSALAQPSRRANAVWARYQWFAGVHGVFDRDRSPYETPHREISGSEISAFAETMRANQIRDLYVFTGSLGAGGTYPLWPLDDPRAPPIVDRPLTRLRQLAPSLRILAWVGGIHAGFARGHIDLRDPEVRAAAAALCDRLVNEGKFDGVHLNIEPGRNDDDAYVALLDQVRESLPAGKVFSLAAPKVLPWVPPVRVLTDHFWDVAFTARVSARVDQIAFMTYDTFMPLVKLHRAFLRLQTLTAVQAVRMGNPSAEVLLGVPTYDEYNISHVRHVETLENTLLGIRAGLGELGTHPSPFAGVAIYAAWTTSKEEWRLYRALWLGRKEGRGVDSGAP